MDVPAETINLDASSNVIFRYITSSIGNISKKPLVGFGVVGTNTFINFFCRKKINQILYQPLLLNLSPNLEDVVQPNGLCYQYQLHLHNS